MKEPGKEPGLEGLSEEEMKKLTDTMLLLAWEILKKRENKYMVYLKLNWNNKVVSVNLN